MGIELAIELMQRGRKRKVGSAMFQFINRLDAGDLYDIGEVLQMDYGLGLEYPVEIYILTECFNLPVEQFSKFVEELL